MSKSQELIICEELIETAIKLHVALARREQKTLDEEIPDWQLAVLWGKLERLTESAKLYRLARQIKQGNS